jgi:hypothetical protein
MLDDFTGVNVAILNRPAAGAVVDAVAQRLRCHPSAAVSFLGSSAWVDLRDQTTSICGFVIGERDQLAPRALSTDRASMPRANPVTFRFSKAM